MICEIVFFVL